MFQPDAGLRRKRRGKECILPVKIQTWGFWSTVKCFSYLATSHSWPNIWERDGSHLVMD